MAFVMQSCIQMKRSIRTILIRVWSSSCFTATVKPLSPFTDHCWLQGWRKGQLGPPYLSKSGFGLGSGAQSKLISAQFRFLMASTKTTGSSWLQMVDWFLQSKDKEQVYSFIPGAVLERFMETESFLLRRAFFFFFFLHFSLLSQILLAGSSWWRCF